MTRAAGPPHLTMMNQDINLQRACDFPNRCADAPSQRQKAFFTTWTGLTDNTARHRTIRTRRERVVNARHNPKKKRGSEEPRCILHDNPLFGGRFDLDFVVNFPTLREVFNAIFNLFLQVFCRCSASHHELPSLGPQDDMSRRISEDGIVIE